jgi:hypothetical protein
MQQLGLPHFFDQNDNAMQLGKVNSEQMTQAAWTCRVGVVVLSDKFSDSKWCLRELNTFLLRRHQEPQSQFLLLPIYYNSHLLETHPLYYPAIGSVSSVVRKNEDAAHEFLVTLVPRLLSIPELSSHPAVKQAQKRLEDDPFLVKHFWNEYVQSSIMDKAEHKLFVNPRAPPVVGHAEADRIKALHKTLTPQDIKAGLEVYQPLEYSLTPPVIGVVSEALRYSLELVSQALLENKDRRSR